MKALGKKLVNWCVLISLCCMITLLCGISVDAAESDFEYRVNGNNEVTITKYVGTEKNVVIPDTLGGGKVTAIGSNAFEYCSSLTSIMIPEGMKSIDSYAFYGCSSLASIEIPEGVTSIGSFAFFGCQSLMSIKIPESVTSMDTSAFGSCGSLKTAGPIGSGTNIEFGWTKSIPDRTFSECGSLTSIVIPEGVTRIGSSVFDNCRNLTSIVMPESLMSIGDKAFSGCSGLTSIVIPEGVTSIGWSAFDYCSSLEHIVIPESVTSMDSYVFEGCDGLKTAGPIGIGTNIEFGWTKSIPADAFLACSSLTSIVMPEGMIGIGSSAFSGCSSLTSIVIPKGVTSIGSSAFLECSSLGNIVIPEGMASIGHSAFEGCSSLTSIFIPGSVTSIGYSAFEGCSSLKTAGPIGSGTDIEFGWTKAIPAHAFDECSSLTNIMIPETVTSIGYSVFDGCSGLTNITIPEGVTSIGASAFSGCSSLTSIVIPNGVTSIGASAFSGCSSLESVTMSKVKIIGESAFEECTSLTSIVLPKTVTQINNYAFRNCTSLEKVLIKSQKAQMGDFVFFRAPLTIYGHAGSNVEIYAINEAINFIALPDLQKLSAFVERLYTLVLGREADENGLESWSNALITHESSGVDVGFGFVFSDECKDRSLSNEEFVNMLYLTFMNREADEDGRKAWVSQLDSGVEREKVFEGFVYSEEFLGICKEYGIEVGNTESVAAFAEALSHYRNQNADITAFVTRCYTKALGREYDPVGLEDWCRVIVTQEDTPTAVAKSFIFAEEFMAKGLDDEEYVKVLYQTFMGREADEVGLAGWISVLQSGEEDREKVLDGFAGSLEFAEILEGFGLN